MEAQHQNPEEAVEGMLLCKAEFAAGCHWGTFHLTNEPVEEPRHRLLAALDARGIARERFRPMLPGEVWDIPCIIRQGCGVYPMAIYRGRLCANVKGTEVAFHEINLLVVTGVCHRNTPRSGGIRRGNRRSCRREAERAARRQATAPAAIEKFRARRTLCGRRCR